MAWQGMRWILALAWAASAPAWGSEQWIVATDLWGNRSYQTLDLDATGAQLQGRLDADPVRGTRHGDTIAFVATSADGRVSRFDGPHRGRTHARE